MAERDSSHQRSSSRSPQSRSGSSAASRSSGSRPPSTRSKSSTPSNRPPRPPRSDQDRRAEAPKGPRIPDEITGEELDKKVAFELKTLPEELATFVARCLVATSLNLDENPADALYFAQLAKRKAGRVAVVREAVGMAEYFNGHYQEALNEFRAAKRMTGSVEYLPLMADCERGLGRPERALDLAKSEDARKLDEDGKAELLLVAAGARRDLDQLDAAIVMLAGPAAKADAPLRVRYAYADALEAAGRSDDASALFREIAAVDDEVETDADIRAGVITGVAFLEEPLED